MKNIVLALVIISVLFSCKKNEKVPLDDALSIKNEVKDISKDSVKEGVVKKTYDFKLDSIKIEDSLILKNKLDYDSHYLALVFPDVKNQVLLDSIYLPISRIYETKINKFSRNDLVSKIKEISKKNKNIALSSVNDIQSPNMDYTAYDLFGMSINKEINKFVIIEYNFEGMSPGAAHPFHHSEFRTFDFKNNKQIHIEDILIDKNKFWKNIVPKYIPKDMVFDEYRKSVPITENSNFDDKFINFNYNEYEIGPYVSGLISIQIPFSDLKPYLKPEFVQRMNIK